MTTKETFQNIIMELEEFKGISLWDLKVIDKVDNCGVLTARELEITIEGRRNELHRNRFIFLAFDGNHEWSDCREIVILWFSWIYNCQFKKACS